MWSIVNIEMLKTAALGTVALLSTPGFLLMPHLRTEKQETNQSFARDISTKNTWSQILCKNELKRDCFLPDAKINSDFAVVSQHLKRSFTSKRCISTEESGRNMGMTCNKRPGRVFRTGYSPTHGTASQTPGSWTQHVMYCIEDSSSL